MQRILSYRVGNLQGVGARERQEDAFATVNAFDVMKIKEQGLFFAVCDGMGGMADGALASQTAVASLRNSFLSIDNTCDIAMQLKDSVYKASSEILDKIGGEGGSTVVAGIIFKECLYYVSVGDSYLWLFRDNSLYKLNREQNVCHQKYMSSVRNGIIDPSDYQDEEEAVALTDFLGMIGLDDVDCSLHPLPLKDGDILLACSDGVGGVLTENEIKAALCESSEQDMCRHLEQNLVDYNRMNQDNYTAIVVRCIY